MRTLILIFSLIFGFLFFADAQTNPNHVYVNGYYKSNGTYVKGHYRTAPNHTINDNFSTYPNVNPYTGERGTVQPEYNYNSYSLPSLDNSYSLPSYSLPKNTFNNTNSYYYDPFK